MYKILFSTVYTQDKSSMESTRVSKRMYETQNNNKINLKKDMGTTGEMSQTRSTRVRDLILNPRLIPQT